MVQHSGYGCQPVKNKRNSAFFTNSSDSNDLSGKEMQIPFRKTRKGIVIEVKVEPRSSVQGITGVIDTVLKVKLTAPPVGGAANEQLIEILSEETGIRKSDIKIVRGLSSKNKLVEIKGINSV